MCVYNNWSLTPPCCEVVLACFLNKESVFLHLRVWAVAAWLTICVISRFGRCLVTSAATLMHLATCFIDFTMLPHKHDISEKIFRRTDDTIKFDSLIELRFTGIGRQHHV